MISQSQVEVHHACNFQPYCDKQTTQRSPKRLLFANLGEQYWSRKSDLGAAPYGYVPIHDAIEVELDHMSCGCEAMKEAWEAEIEGIHKGAKAMVSTAHG